MQALIAIVNDEFEVDITDKTRKRPVVIARKAFSFILRESNLSLAGIGGYMGKDHATVIHYLRDIDFIICLLYTSPSPRDRTRSRMPSSA